MFKNRKWLSANCSSAAVAATCEPGEQCDYAKLRMYDGWLYCAAGAILYYKDVRVCFGAVLVR